MQAVVSVIRLVAKVLLVVLAAASLTILLSCASAPQSKRIPTCLTDPINDALHCDGVTQPWKDSGGYVCHKLDDHEEYFRGCR